MGNLIRLPSAPNSFTSFNMRVQTKLILLAALTVIIFLGATLFQFQSIKTILVDFFRQEVEEKRTNFYKLIELKGKSLETIVFDYTYWDEMAHFVAVPDPKWAKDILETSLSSYNISAIWVYRLDKSLIYSTINVENGDELKELSLLKEIVGELFSDSPFGHFFMDTPAGLLEIRGATIHPGFDVERKTPPQGYFFAGRLWDKNYIDELSTLTVSKISVVPPSVSVEGAKPMDYEKGIIHFSSPLPDWKGQLLKHLSVSIESSSIEKLNQRFKTSFLESVIAAGVILFILFIVLTVWLGFPLQAISKALKKEDTAYLQPLQKDKTEFGDISRLICQFFNQKADLVTEIAKRKEIERKMEALIAELQLALARVKTLSGLLPICASCKKIRDDKGYWNRIETYIRDHSEATFSHGICPECVAKLYPEEYSK